MPKFRVDTDQGSFILDLDKPPRDQAELMSLAEEALGGGGARRQPRIPEPPRGPGFLDVLGEELKGGGEEFLFGGATAPLGAARIAGAPFTAAGRFAGGRTLEATGSPALATAADIAANVGTGAGVGGLARLGSRGFRRLVAPRLPGAGTALREAGRETAEALPGRILPARRSDELFGALEQMDVPPIQLPRFNQIAQELAKQEKDLSRFGLSLPRVSRVAGKATSATEKVTPGVKLFGPEGQEMVLGGGKELTEVPFEALQALRRRLGVAISSARRQGGEELGDLKQLFRALSDDLENAAGTKPAFGLLREANKAARKEFASDDLAEIVAKGINRPRQGTEVADVSYAQMLKGFRDKVRKDELFRGSFNANERKAIESTLEELSKIPVSPPPKGGSFGSGRGFRQASVGEMVGQAAGLPPGIGAATGVLAATAIETLLQSSAGRRALLGIIRNQPRITAKTASLLTAAARATTELEGAIGDARFSTTEQAR